MNQCQIDCERATTVRIWCCVWCTIFSHFWCTYTHTPFETHFYLIDSSKKKTTIKFNSSHKVDYIAFTEFYMSDLLLFIFIGFNRVLVFIKNHLSFFRVHISLLFYYPSKFQMAKSFLPNAIS